MSSATAVDCVPKAKLPLLFPNNELHELEPILTHVLFDHRQGSINLSNNVPYMCSQAYLHTDENYAIPHIPQIIR
jgi:hypothetical protein